jgi:hypothetical protein
LDTASAFTLTFIDKLDKRSKLRRYVEMHVPEHVAASPQDVCPLLNGMRISQLTLSTADGAPFDLAEALSAKPAVLVFYRGGW